MDPRTQVSVVIPAYEAADFIAATLATVATQTVLPREVFVVDDGSSYDTCAVVEAFSRDNPQLQFRLLREPHHGPGAARNAGVRAATGTWIAFLDSDDLWEPAKLERMAAASRQAPGANFLCHNEMHRRRHGSITAVDYSKGYRADRSLLEQLFVRNRFSTSAVLCRRDIILDCGGFDTTLPNAQDYELWLRMSPRLRVLFVTEVLGTYVERAGNITSGRAWRRVLNVLRVLHRHREKVGRITYMKTLARCLLAQGYHALRQLGKAFGAMDSKSNA